MTPEGGRTRGSLSREDVLTKAMEIADRDGPEGLTMRRLAGELGIGAMTVYGHVRTKDELLDGVVELAVGELEIPSTGPWHERLLSLFTALHSLLQRHPTVLHAQTQRPLTGPSALRLWNAALGMLRDGGLERRSAVEGLRVLNSFTFGSALLRLEPSAEVRDEYERDIRGANPRDLPHLAALANPFLAPASDDEFIAGIRLIIAGLAARGMTRRA